MPAVSSGAPGGVTRAVDPAAFLGARRYHAGGLADRLRPGEVPAIMRRGEEVLTETDPRHRHNLGGPREVKVEIRNEGRAQRVTEARARVDLKRLVVGIVTEDAESGGPTRQVIARIAAGGTV